jgi:hypothetical protein
LYTLEGYGINYLSLFAMPFSTLLPTRSSFQFLPATGGVHRPVIERLLPSTVYISVYPRQNVKSETNMFRHGRAALLAETVPFPKTILPRSCPAPILPPNSPKAREVTR